MTVTTENDTSITFDAETDTYRLHYDRRSDESVTTAVTRAIAAVTNTPPTDLDPLFETIDPDALNQLYAPTHGGSSRDDGWVSFHLNNCVVIVDATGEIEITPDEDDNPITGPVPRTVRDR